MEDKQKLEIIATNIRKFRAINRFSQEKLAECANLSQQFVCAIEKCKVNPSILTMDRIANALDVTVNDLIY